MFKGLRKDIDDQKRVLILEREKIARLDETLTLEQKERKVDREKIAQLNETLTLGTGIKMSDRYLVLRPVVKLFFSWFNVEE